MVEIWANNAASTLASPITSTATTLDVAASEGARFASPTGGDFFYATLVEGANVEIVRCTARSTDTLTIVRAQQGTGVTPDVEGFAFSAGVPVENRLTRDTLVGLRDVPAARVTVTELGSATYEDLQEIHNLTRSAGHLDGGEITPGTGEEIDVAAGQGLIRATPDDTSTLFAFDWPATPGIPIPTDTIRYVRVNYNGGAPVVVVSASEDYDYRTAFPLGFVINEGTDLYINETPHSTGRVAGRMARRNYEVEGRQRTHALGGLIISESGATRTLAVTAGVTWLRGLREDIAAFDSNAGGTFDRYYRSATPGEWTKETLQTVAPAGTWDDGDGTLGAIGNNNYVNYWWYLGPGSGIVMVYGRADHNAIAIAQAEGPPGDLPLRLQVGSILLGRFIVRRQGAAFNVVQVDSAFTSGFVPTPVSDHGTLAGLADDDHPQYYLVTTTLDAIATPVASVEFAQQQALQFVVENRTDDPVAPAPGQLWFRTDL